MYIIDAKIKKIIIWGKLKLLSMIRYTTEKAIPVIIINNIFNIFLLKIYRKSVIKSVIPIISPQINALSQLVLIETANIIIIAIIRE
jgi:hypothetical protein